MHIPWSDVELVVAIADAGSLSKAARALGLTQPTVSRRLAELEAALGEPLFARAVAGTAPTAFGERVLAPARRMAEHAAELGQALADADDRVSGTVRISAAPGMCHAFLAPFAALARAELPAVRLELMATTRYVDLVRREAELALRWQSTARRDRQRDLVVLAEVEHAVVAVAAPRYVATLPPRYRPADLAWVGWCPPFEHLAPNPQLAAAIPGFAPALGADDYLVQVRAAEAGAGALVSSRLRYRHAPPSPLVELDLALGAPPVKTHLVAGRASLAIPRVRAVAELLARELATTVPAAPASRRRAKASAARRRDP